MWFDTKKLINFHSLSALSAHFWRLCHNELSTKKKDVKHQNSFYYITLKPHKTCLLLALKHELIGGSVLLRRHTVLKFEIFSEFSVKSILTKFIVAKSVILILTEGLTFGEFHPWKHILDQWKCQKGSFFKICLELISRKKFRLYKNSVISTLWGSVVQRRLVDVWPSF